MAAAHASNRSLFGVSIPDFGLTEKVSNAFNQGRTTQGGSNLYGSQSNTTLAPSQENKGTYIPIQVNKTPVVKNSGATQTPAAKTGSGGGTQQTQQVSQPSNNGYDPEAEARARQEQERADYERRVAEERSAISAEFDPIFSELDRQVGLLPAQRKELEDSLSGLAESQKTGVKQREDQGIEALDESGEVEKGNAKVSLRNLEEDVRNLMQAREFFFGSVGAGDSSAPGMASEAISKGALRARGTVLASRDAGLAEIETKKQDVRNLSTTENRKIDEWKSTRMYDLVEKFQARETELSSAKANATGAKAKAINDVIRGMSNDLLGELRRLDDQVTQYKTSVSTWQMQREAELEDYASKLSLSSKYSSTATPKYSEALGTFQKLYGTGQMSMSEARNAVQNQFGIDPLSGLELSPEQGKAKKRSLADELSDEMLMQTFTGQE